MIESTRPDRSGLQDCRTLPLYRYLMAGGALAADSIADSRLDGEMMGMGCSGSGGYGRAASGGASVTTADQPVVVDNDDKTKTKTGSYYPPTLWILIFTGHPRDIQSARETQLYVAFDADESTNLTFSVRGQYPSFRVREAWNQPPPHARPHFYRRLAVSTLPPLPPLAGHTTITTTTTTTTTTMGTGMTGTTGTGTGIGTGLDLRLRDAIMATQVSHREPDWNCQSWVGDVLTELEDANLISEEESEYALNGMVNYISQAPWR
ncbi:hypothetical protein GGR56DRAFT_600796 [Xylariaceae sp. FL0804]|nr:hypothetical protein GGR56DRAFT_600796 [Xylariaceae sp. FL0804]